MRKLRKLAVGIVAVLLVLVAAGCTGRSIVISWSPIPIVVKPGDMNIKGTVTIRATGTFGSLYIDTVSAVVFDEDGNPIEEYTQELKVNVTIPPFVGGTRSEDVTLNVTYDDIETRRIAKVVVQVTGSDPGKLEVDVIRQQP